MDQDSRFGSRMRTIWRVSMQTSLWGARGLPLVLALSLFTPHSALSQTGNAVTADQASADIEKAGLKVNPLTGQVSASGSDYRPLTAQERWRLYFKQNYWSVGAYFGPLASAFLLDQATGDPKEWGGGFVGYGRRLGSRLGASRIQGTFQAPLAALLGEDTRYILSGDRRAKHRAAHALLYGFLTYNNHGHPTLNVASLGGYYAASAASTLWLPGQRNIALYTLGDGSKQAGLGALVNWVQEFWPEIHRMVFRGP